jgi:hypothetical protein
MAMMPWSAQMPHAFDICAQAQHTDAASRAAWQK